MHVVKSFVRALPAPFSSLIRTSARHVRNFFYVVDSYSRPGETARQIRQIVGSGRPIVVGPWLSEVGFEILYWIPFLRWVQQEVQMPPDRTTVISRGGAHLWYKGIADHYVEVFDHFTPEEFKARNEQRITEAGGGQKQVVVSDFDQELIGIARQQLHTDEVALLPPMLMYNLFRVFWGGRSPVKTVLKQTVYDRFPPATDYEGLADLPDDYVAVKFYFRSSFPDTAANRAFIMRTLENLCRHSNVVLLDTGLNIDDHTNLAVETTERLFNANHLMTPQTNLEVQTKIISRARAFVGTYGGFSYLAPYYGVPSISFYSIPNYNHSHLDIAHRAFSSFENGTFIVLGADDAGLMRLIAG